MKTKLNEKLNAPVKVGDRIRVCFHGGKQPGNGDVLFKPNCSIFVDNVTEVLSPTRIRVRGRSGTIRSWIRVRD